ncbi:MAG: cupin domain-containing protein [Proteobacteria bacterium]|nr:cupin domain-containing protein [Pseudomonadota bacterium]
MSVERHLQRLLDAAQALIGDRLVDGESLARFIGATTVCAPLLAPKRLPACRHWEPALSLADSAGDPIAEALAPLVEVFHWVQNPNYTVATMGAGFMDNYAYANVVGTRSLIGGGGYALGVLLLGPGLTYPPHAHPANEVYYIVGGSAEWRRGDGPWTSRATGSLIQHPSGLVHATRTGDDPLLALYLWWGDIETHARLMPRR